MIFRVREIDKNDEADWKFFDELQFDSFRVSTSDRDQLSEAELTSRYRTFLKEHPIDYLASNQIIFIAESETGERAGLIWIADRASSWKYKERHVWIYNLNALKKYRKKGIASMLLAAAEKYALENGLAIIGLHVLDFNANARALYEKHEYALVETQNESCYYQKNLK